MEIFIITLAPPEIFAIALDENFTILLDSLKFVSGKNVPMWEYFPTGSIFSEREKVYKRDIYSPMRMCSSIWEIFPQQGKLSPRGNIFVFGENEGIFSLRLPRTLRFLGRTIWEASCICRQRYPLVRFPQNTHLGIWEKYSPENFWGKIFPR